MKSLEVLYNEVIASDELKAEFLEAFQTKEATEAVLKKYDCDASVEELQSFLNEKQENQELSSEEDIKAIAGGTKGSEWIYGAVSVTTTIIGCSAVGAISCGVAAAKKPEQDIEDSITCF